MNTRHSSTNKALLTATVLALALVAAPAFSQDRMPTHAHAADESQEPVSDSWITTKVKADLLTTKHVPGTEVKVETMNGVVMLSGTVATAAEREKAISVAKGIKGVSSVEATELKVVPGKK